MGTSDRSHLKFEDKVRNAFDFLSELGVYEVEASPTLVRYRKGGVEVDVYHGRQSYEIGAGVTAFGTRCPISAIIRSSDSEAHERFRYAMTTTPEGVTTGLEELSSLMKRYARQALKGDSKFFSMLENQQRRWAEEYALDVLAEQLRPQAEEAFRQRDYSKAADLYSRIRERLSRTDIRKLSLAEARRRKEVKP